MLIFLYAIDDDNTRDCLEKIYVRYKKELFYISYNILKDMYEAEDVVQNTIIKFVDYMDKDTEVDCKKTKGLLVIIVRSLSINIYNQRKNRKTTLVETYTDEMMNEEDNNPEIEVLRIDKSREIARILSNMNTGYADVLSLKYVYGYSNAEISSILAIHEDNVRQRLLRARKALAEILVGGDFNA